MESADVEFETRSLSALARSYPRHFTLITRNARACASYPSCVAVYPPRYPIATCSMSLIPSAPFASSVLSALAEKSLFSMRCFVALLELGELLLRAGDVGLVRTAELKELPLPTKV